MSRDLPDDLATALGDLLDSANVCRLLSFADLEDLLPMRALSCAEADAFVGTLAAHGFHVIEPDAAARLAKIS